MPTRVPLTATGRAAITCVAARFRADYCLCSRGQLGKIGLSDRLTVWISSAG
jgi:hypothetical protein